MDFSGKKIDDQNIEIYIGIWMFLISPFNEINVLDVHFSNVRSTYGERYDEPK